MYPSLTRLKALWQRITRTDIGLISAGVAFFGFLAIFPALAAIIAIWGFAADPAMVQTQLDLAEGYLPAEAYDLIYGQVQRILASNNRSLGLATVLSTLFALWSARAGVSALVGGLNAIQGQASRGGIAHQGNALLLTIILIGLSLVAIALAVIAPLAMHFLPVGPAEELVLRAANFALGLLVVTMAIAVTYRYGPIHAVGVKRPRLITRGLIIAIVVWVAASRGLVFYLTNFNSYNEVYGSIGAVVALLMWFYISAYAVLLGAAIDVEYRKSLGAQ